MAITIPEAVRQMLIVVEQLRVAYPKKAFTLDGRLVGDIGEVLVEDAYDLELYENVKARYDAECSDGRKVQIKATMKETLTFPADHVPDYYLGVKIHPDGSFTEIFNGPGKIAGEAIKNRTTPKTNLHSIAVATLKISGRRSVLVKRFHCALLNHRQVKIHSAAIWLNLDYGIA